MDPTGNLVFDEVYQQILQDRGLEEMDLVKEGWVAVTEMALVSGVVWSVKGVSE